MIKFYQVNIIFKLHLKNEYLFIINDKNIKISLIAYENDENQIFLIFGEDNYLEITVTGHPLKKQISNLEYYSQSW